MADEHKAYDDLVGLVAMHRVNHSLQYQEDDGTNSNVIESFFSRVEILWQLLHNAAFKVVGEHRRLTIALYQTTAPSP
nr:transposase [Neorhizobium sp. T25_27]